MADSDTNTGGRPSKYGERMSIYSVTMPKHLVEYAETVGESFSDGVRKCIEAHQESTEYEG